MKKIMLRVLALCAAVVMAISLASCGGSNGKQFATVQEYIESPEMVEVIEGISSTFEPQGLTVNAYADGDCLVYEYKFTQQMDVNDTVVQSLADSIDEMSDTVQSSLEEVKSVVDVETPSAKYVYLNADGSEIYSKVFTYSE